MQSPPSVTRARCGKVGFAALVLLLATLGFLFPVLPASASPSGTPEETWVANGRVNSMVQVGDRVYLGGNFTQVGPNVGYGAALSSDGGQRDTAFPKVDGKIWVAVPDGSGGFYLGGEFSRVGSYERSRLAHVLADGGVASWNPGANSTVRALALSPDGRRLYAGGTFTKVANASRSRLAAIDATTGTVDGAWTSNANNTVTALAVSPDGRRLYAGGIFTTLRGIVRNRLAALDASTGGVASAWNPDADGAVNTLALSADGGRLFAGGEFTGVGGAARNRLAAVDATTGTIDPDWDPGTDGPVHALVSSGGKIYAGGGFANIGGAGRNRLAAVDAATGTVDPAWNPGADNVVTALALSADGGSLFVGGAFAKVGNASRSRLAAVDATTGTVGSSWNPTANGAVNALAVGGGRVYAGGDFTSVGGIVRNRLAAVDASTGVADSSWNPSANSEVHALALSADGGRLYVGGGFTRVGGVVRNRLAAVDIASGAVDQRWDVGTDAIVRALAVSGSHLYVGGDFTLVKGQQRKRLALVDGVTGDLSPMWVPTANGKVRSLVLLQGEDRIYAAGEFTGISGSTRLKLAALDPDNGALDPNWRPDPNYLIWDLDVSSTHVYAAGAGVGGTMAAFDTTKPLNPGEHTWQISADGDFQALIVRDSVVYAGGHFDKVSGQVRHRLVAVDAATGGVESRWAPSLFGASSTDRGVWSMAGKTGPRLYIGGDFRKVEGQVQQGYAQFPDVGAS